ncbi:GTPase activating protein (GAP) for Rho1p [Sporothrix stenoceras]|uniref:GTPase activating protein (GAP) for Rho1p n=1 Tax=Sporothrix stenoceras TaxID=5173 RepID=A0ABR3Z2S9_9PEZI
MPTPQANPASPPTKRDLKSWWKGFKLQSRNHDVQEQAPRGIFGVPLRQSIAYANVAISLIDENGKSYIYGYVPIVVAKCGVFLKEKATDIEGIFRLSGSEKRIKELKLAFDSPDRYGKGLSWAGYTVHDAANVLRRYLNDLPEPVVPLVLYDRFREPLRHAIKQGTSDADGPQFMENFDMAGAIRKYQDLITELPPLNRQLLLYILDLLAVFAAKADVNRMNSQNLAAIFQPGILSHPTHAMAPEEYRLNQTVLIFLIENQDHFLIGMRGTAADEQTVQEVSRGTPPVTPGVQIEGAGVVGVTRTASNASAGAESVARDGKIRRNRSTSSRNSRHSRHSGAHVGTNNVGDNSAGLGSDGNNHVGHASSPRSSSPGIASTPTTAGSGSGGGLSRSNTLPARSPGIGPGRFAKRSDLSASPVSPLTPINPHPSSQAAPVFDPVAEVVTPAEDSNTPDPFTTVMMEGATHVAPPRDVPGLGFSPATPISPTAEGGTGTPTKERRFQLFQRSNTNDNGTGELKPQPNKLKKKRLPSSANPSAQSSTASLPTSSAFASPNYEPSVNPLEEHTNQLAVAAAGGQVPDESWGHRKEHIAPTGSDGANDSTPRVSQVPSAATTATTTPTPTNAPAAAAATATAHESKLRPSRNSPSQSLHSSFNEGSDIDQVDESAAAQAAAAQLQDTHAEPAEKTKKRLWRLSRRRDDMQPPQVPAQAQAPAPGATPQPGASHHPSTGNLSSVSTPPGQGSSLGSNVHAGISTSSVGSGGPSLAGVGSLSLTGASGSSDPALAYADSGHESEHSKGKISGWLKNKYREAKETAEQRRNKSPSPTDQQSAASASTLSGVIRGRSLDLDRVAEENEKSP